MLFIFSSNAFSTPSNSDNSTLFVNPEVSIEAYISDNSKIDSLKDQLSAKWNFNINVQKQGQHKIVNNCESTLAAYIHGFRPVRQSEFGAYQYSYIQCQSIDLITQMTSPTKSYIQRINLDKHTLNLVPASVGEVISNDDQRKINKYPAMTLGEFTHITKVTQKDNYSVEIEDDSDGIQYMTILAKGDFNGDHIEDLLLSVNNQVKEGSYNTYNLYILTKTHKNGVWEIVTKFPEPH
ncbi:hypothetical protein VQ7734_01150 [Vibrio quintilis]|uniref:Uncharacterized protein n=2 Tax=Vibrio quintilis TaxID=1117707 RepID=A0A1M7YS19_9VIBR|nr:hypothetical protein VQ7734_01150 [Vibrio quintilis]